MEKKCEGEKKELKRQVRFGQQTPYGIVGELRCNNFDGPREAEVTVEVDGQLTHLCANCLEMGFETEPHRFTNPEGWFAALPSDLKETLYRAALEHVVRIGISTPGEEWIIKNFPLDDEGMAEARRCETSEGDWYAPAVEYHNRLAREAVEASIKSGEVNPARRLVLAAMKTAGVWYHASLSCSVKEWDEGGYKELVWTMAVQHEIWMGGRGTLLFDWVEEGEYLRCGKWVPQSAPLSPVEGELVEFLLEGVVRRPWRPNPQSLAAAGWDRREGVSIRYSAAGDAEYFNPGPWEWAPYDPTRPVPRAPKARVWKKEKGGEWLRETISQTGISLTLLSRPSAGGSRKTFAIARGGRCMGANLPLKDFKEWCRLLVRGHRRSRRLAGPATGEEIGRLVRLGVLQEEEDWLVRVSEARKAGFHLRREYGHETYSPIQKVDGPRGLAAAQALHAGFSGEEVRSFLAKKGEDGGDEVVVESAAYMADYSEAEEDD